jgi:hypothetical protein
VGSFSGAFAAAGNKRLNLFGILLKDFLHAARIESTHCAQAVGIESREK